MVGDFHHLDVLHNNAATKGADVRAFFAPFEDYPIQVWREVMSVSIDGMFLVAQGVGGGCWSRARAVHHSDLLHLRPSGDRIYDGSDYLASDAASYLTGQVVAIDGGSTAW